MKQVIPTLVGVLALLLSPLLLVQWHGRFDSFYVPLQEHHLQEPTLQSLLEAARASGKPCFKPARVVVTLSTFPGRLGKLKMAVGSLVSQSCPPDAIRVFISKSPRTKRVSAMLKSGSHGDDVIASDTFVAEVKALGQQVIVQEIEKDWGPATKLLAALEVENDPSTFLITVDDDTRYHKDMVLALVVAATNLPPRMAPAFWCEEAWADGYRSLKKRTIEGDEQGTVHGWCGGFAGVLFKRFMFDHQVFNFTAAPEGCLLHDDVWWGGHLLSAGNSPYRIRPGFFSVEWSPSESTERQDASVHVLDALAKERGADPQADCASWFSGLRGIHLDGDGIPEDVYKHEQATAQSGQDLWVLKRFFSDWSETGVVPRRGTFVEFGALDGVMHSNTNFFEKHLKWRGVLAEPSKHFGHLLAKNRPGSVVVEGAVCGKGGMRNFVDTPWPGLSGFEDTYDPEVLADMKAGRLWFNITSITPMLCHTLKDLLDKANLKRVNYMTVDTEGSEYEVLANFPFPDYQVDVIQVEVHMKGCYMMRAEWTRADPWNFWCRHREAADQLVDLMMSRGYTIVKTFIHDIDGSKVGRMHERWLPAYYASEVTADLIFYHKP